MANILTTYVSGTNLYYVIIDSAGRIWNGSLFQSVNLSNWLSYVFPLTEVPPPGTFEASFPAIHIADTYSLIAYQRIGATPAITDPAVRVGTIGWNGHSEVDIGGGGGGGGSNFEESFDIGISPPVNISILPGVTAINGNIEIITGEVDIGGGGGGGGSNFEESFDIGISPPVNISILPGVTAINGNIEIITGSSPA